MPMPLSKPKLLELNLTTNGLRLPYRLLNLPASTLKDYGSALVHLTSPTQTPSLSHEQISFSNN